MTLLGLVIRAARDLGWKPMSLIARYQLELRSGLLRARTPLRTWEDNVLDDWLRADFSSDVQDYLQTRLNSPARFFFGVQDQLDSQLQFVLGDRQQELFDEADALLGGTFRLFGLMKARLGFPPDWGVLTSLEGSPSGSRIDLEQHWTVSANTTPGEDIKLLWELSRFGWIYPLARAYKLSGDIRYAEGAWQLIDSWVQANLPNAGPNWVSAQEVALRLMALIFGMYAFWEKWATEPERISRLVSIIGVHAQRIPPSINYSRAQGNNHLLTEAAALYTTGLLFPELRSAARWKRLGREWLLDGLQSQFFSDGGYVQHSHNYQRLALQAGLWASILAERNQEPLPERALDALKRGSRFLHAVVDPQSGAVSNFGSNDGAQILPLSTCSYTDYRPTLQTAADFFKDPRLFSSGPWDEYSLWMGLLSEKGDQNRTDPGIHSLETPAHEQSSFPRAGLWIASGKRTRGFLRAANFTSRPAHSDQLHLDLWWGGNNVIRDSGTYLYSGDSPWNNGLAGAVCHNGPVVDDEEPMQKAGRFLWLNWSRASVIHHRRSPDNTIEVLVSEQDGYQSKNVLVQRTLLRAGDTHWIIVDDLFGAGEHSLRTGWLFPDLAWRRKAGQVSLEHPAGEIKCDVEGAEKKMGLFRSGQCLEGELQTVHSNLLGWYSPSYAVREPALFVAAQISGKLPLRITTTLGFGTQEQDQPLIEWQEPVKRGCPFQSVEYLGERIEF
jgi:hypothetical protein